MAKEGSPGDEDMPPRQQALGSNGRKIATLPFLIEETFAADTPASPLDSESLSIRTGRALGEWVQEPHFTEEEAKDRGENVAYLKPTK